MREIKFRVWNNVSKDYTYFGTPLLSLDKKEGCPLEFLRPSESKAKVMLSGYGDLEQHTGQKDKNGVEIYEGDKVKAPAMGTDAICEVFWDINCWCLKDQNGSTTGLYPHGGEFTPEVVGNIHENPEAKE